MFEHKRIMIVVAHPDDELLGLGATMHKLIREEGIITRVVILGEGITSRADARDVEHWKSELKKHKQNIELARAAIGYNEVKAYDFPDNRFDTVPLLDIIKVVEKEKKEFDPEVIFTHHGGDLNIDHRRTFEAVITACRPMEKEPVKAIFTFETPSGTEWRASTDPHAFIPNYFISVSERDVEAKVAGMESYDYEKRQYPHPRSAQALRILAQRNGIIVGKLYAEAFHLVRTIFD